MFQVLSHFERCHGFDKKRYVKKIAGGVYYIPSFVEIGLPVPEKKIFEGFLPYMDVAAILVM